MLTFFNYVLVGENDKYMILCRENDYDLKVIREIIRHSFPELRDDYENVRIKVEALHEMHSSKFDCLVDKIEDGNNWDEVPFVALWIFKQGNETYCGARPIGKFTLLRKNKLRLMGLFYTKPEISQIRCP